MRDPGGLAVSGAAVSVTGGTLPGGDAGSGSWLKSLTGGTALTAAPYGGRSTIVLPPPNRVMAFGRPPEAGGVAGEP